MHTLDTKQYTSWPNESVHFLIYQIFAAMRGRFLLKCSGIVVEEITSDNF